MSAHVLFNLLNGLSVLRRWFCCCYFLFIVTPTVRVCNCSMFFIVRYFMPILVLQSS